MHNGNVHNGNDGSLGLSWDRCGAAVFIEFTPDLSATAEWTVVDGPLVETNSVIRAPEGFSRGFFRTRVE